MFEQVRVVLFDYVVNRFPSTAVIALFVALVIVSLVAFSSRVSRNTEPKPADDYKSFLHALQREATGIGKRLSRAAFSFRIMSALLATIEILGGAYFAMTGSSAIKAGADQNTLVGQLPIASFLGFAIIVASTIQNRVHPYAKAVELRFRAWQIGY